jgi:PII-like signaling protein
MRAPGAKLTVYFSERARIADVFLADRLIDVYARHRIHTSVLVRGADGFGTHHRLHTDRLLSASENLPAVSIAIDTSERIEAARNEVETVAAGAGLITLERALLVDGAELERLDLTQLEHAADASAPVKLTLYGGRRIRAQGQAGYVTALDHLAAAGAAGASILLAVDGTLHGQRRRARFFARNGDVPLMLIAIGGAAVLTAALPQLAGLLDTPVATVERVQLVRAPGRVGREPIGVPSHDDTGRVNWQKLTVHVREDATHDGRPIHSALVLGLREAGLAGLTTLRGIRGFYGDRPPFADRMWSLRRGAPVLVVAIDTPERMQDCWPLVSGVTAEHGLVTSELVPTSFTAR